MRWLQTVRRLVERHAFVSDAALAFALAALVLSDVWASEDYLTASKAIYVPAGLLMTLPLAWRRRAPLPVATVVMGALVFESLVVGLAPTPDSPLIGWLLAIYTVAAHCGRPAALTGGAMSLAGGLVWIGLNDFFFPVVVFGGAWLAGRMVRNARSMRGSWRNGLLRSIGNAKLTRGRPPPRRGRGSPVSYTTFFRTA